MNYGIEHSGAKGTEGAGIAFRRQCSAGKSFELLQPILADFTGPGCKIPPVVPLFGSVPTARSQ